MMSFSIPMICVLISVATVNGFCLVKLDEPMPRKKQLDLNFEPEDLHYLNPVNGLNRPKRQLFQGLLSSSAVPRDQTVIVVPNGANNGYRNVPGYGTRSDTTVIVSNPDDIYNSGVGRYPYVNPTYPMSTNTRY